jgi:hypothetical protein
MNPTLVRTAYGTTYTAGRMMIAAVTFFSMEPPWMGNLAGLSCVPDGVYDLVPYHSPAHNKDTWCLENLDLGISAFNRAEDRAYCEIHSANWAPQLKGCIALGLSGLPMFYPASGTVQPAVEGSKDAIEAFIEIMEPMSKGHTLTIVPSKGLTGTAGYKFGGAPP